MSLYVHQWIVEHLFTLNSVTHGYHVHKDYWDAPIGEELCHNHRYIIIANCYVAIYVIAGLCGMHAVVLCSYRPLFFHLYIFG